MDSKIPAINAENMEREGLSLSSHHEDFGQASVVPKSPETKSEAPTRAADIKKKRTPRGSRKVLRAGWKIEEHADLIRLQEQLLPPMSWKFVAEILDYVHRGVRLEDLSKYRTEAACIQRYRNDLVNSNARKMVGRHRVEAIKLIEAQDDEFVEGNRVGLSKCFWLSERIKALYGATPIESNSDSANEDGVSGDGLHEEEMDEE